MVKVSFGKGPVPRFWATRPVVTVELAKGVHVDGYIAYGVKDGRPQGFEGADIYVDLSLAADWLAELIFFNAPVQNWLGDDNLPLTDTVDRTEPVVTPPEESNNDSDA